MRTIFKEIITTNPIHINHVPVSLAVILCALVLIGCSGTEDNKSNHTDAVSLQMNDSDAYTGIIASDYITVNEAYEKLEGASSSEPEQTDFLQKLKNLKDCSGKFANTTDRGNVYSADVQFYLSGGKVFSTVSYSGYMGEIGDGEVRDSDETGYLFEADPKGDLYGNELDFHLYFGRDTLHIMWGDTCDYILDRGDGSADAVEDYRVPFEESDIYKKIESLLDENFGDYEYDLVYDKEKRELNLHIQAPDNLRAALNTKDSQLMDSWQKLVDSMKNLSSSLTSVVQIGGKAEYANIYWVDRLNSEHIYTESDCLVWLQNGTVKYNYADHLSSSGGYESADSSKVTGDNSPGYSPGASAGSYSGSATFGEENALDKAYQYLEYSAFSYTGLIEQLEFEGYSHSEAVYAVEHCGADWNEQAVKKAKQYLEYSSFSKSGLIDQLEFEGFTHSQAEYAANMFY